MPPAAANAEVAESRKPSPTDPPVKLVDTVPAVAFWPTASAPAIALAEASAVMFMPVKLPAKLSATVPAVAAAPVPGLPNVEFLLALAEATMFPMFWFPAATLSVTEPAVAVPADAPPTPPWASAESVMLPDRANEPAARSIAIVPPVAFVPWTPAGKVALNGSIAGVPMPSAWASRLDASETLPPTAIEPPVAPFCALSVSAPAKLSVPVTVSVLLVDATTSLRNVALLIVRLALDPPRDRSATPPGVSCPEDSVILPPSKLALEAEL